MADSGSGEKTEEPTPERLRKLREDGNVGKSQDVNTAFSFFAVFCTIGAWFESIGQYCLDFFRVAVRLAHDSAHLGASRIMAVMFEAGVTLAKCCIPPLAVAFVLGIVLNVAQVGFLFSLKPITPDPNKINPINGFKNLFNMKKMVELLKTVLKFTVISYLSYGALRRSIRDVTLIIRSDLFVGMRVISAVIWDFVSKIGVVFILIAAFDAFYQKKRYIKDNRMTKHDIKQEYKQSEGDPHHKAERKRLHHEILSGGGSGVKSADVVVRNPDHIAVALKYDKDKGEAPKVVAKGTRLWAEKILEEARRHDIPIVHNVPLAQALNKLELGDEIPEDLYNAVAEVLNFVYNLSEQQRAKRAGGRRRGGTPP